MKVTGEALYAFEHPLDGPAYGALVQSTIASGEIRALDASDALRVQGVLAVISHENAPRLRAEGELAVLQSPRVCYRGQIVAAVNQSVAEYEAVLTTFSTDWSDAFKELGQLDDDPRRAEAISLYQRIADQLNAFLFQSNPPLSAMRGTMPPQCVVPPPTTWGVAEKFVICASTLSLGR